MNQLDLLILLPLVFFCYRGFVNGLIQEVLSIIGIILAVFLTFQYRDAVSAVLQPFFAPDSTIVPFASAAIIFLGTVAVVGIVAFFSKKILQAIHLNFINRLAGMAFGLLKSGIIISAILIILSAFAVPSEESRKESFLYPYIIPLAPWAYNSVASVYPGAEDFSDIFDQDHSLEQLPF